jgi:transposase-like protein
MPSKRKKTEVTGNGREFVIPSELLDQVVKCPMTQTEVETVCRALKKAVIERAMGAEMNQHLSYESGEPSPPGPKQPSQRHEREDRSDRRRCGAHRSAARPRRQL